MATGVSGTVMVSHGPWLTSMLVGPLVARDGIGAFLAGVLLAVIIEGYRRTRC